MNVLLLNLRYKTVKKKLNKKLYIFANVCMRRYIYCFVAIYKCKYYFCIKNMDVINTSLN